MPNRSAREAMRAGLRRHGLPQADVARLLAEWGDHLQDLITEQGVEMNMETQSQAQMRLGHPDLLIAAAVANHRQTSFFGRHPVWTFVVAPIPLLVLCFIAYVLLLLGIGICVDWAFDFESQIKGKAVRDWPAGAALFIQSYMESLRFVPPALTALVLCWLGRRSGVRPLWLLAACALIAVTAACFSSQLVMPEEPGTGRHTMGFGLPIKVDGISQALVPLAVGTLFILAMLRRRKLAAAAE